MSYLTWKIWRRNWDLTCTQSAVLIPSFVTGDGDVDSTCIFWPGCVGIHIGMNLYGISVFINPRIVLLIWSPPPAIVIKCILRVGTATVRLSITRWLSFKQVMVYQLQVFGYDRRCHGSIFPPIAWSPCSIRHGAHGQVLFRYELPKDNAGSSRVIRWRDHDGGF